MDEEGRVAEYLKRVMDLLTTLIMKISLFITQLSNKMDIRVYKKDNM